MHDVTLPDDDHVSRYCKPTAVGRDGLPTAAAFELRPAEDHLSVNWLQYLDADLGIAVERVQEVFHRKGYRLRRNGKFAVVGVGPALSAVAEAIGQRGRIKHLPLEDDESHAGLFGYGAGDLAVAVELRALVRPEHVYPAVFGA